MGPPEVDDRPAEIGGPERLLAVRLRARVEDGPLALLYYGKQPFGDFRLRLEWKTFSHDTNSGVFLRMPPEPPEALANSDPYYARCLEIQID